MKRIALLILLLASICSAQQNNVMMTFAVIGDMFDGTFYWNCDGTAESDYVSTESLALSVSGAIYSGGGILCDATGEWGQLANVSNTTIAHQGTIEFDYTQGGAGPVSGFGRFFDVNISGSSEQFTLYRNNSNTFINFAVGGVTGNFTVTTNIFDGSKYHIKVTWDDSANERKIYIDDVQEGSTSTSSITVPTWSGEELWIGNRADGARPSDGIIDEVEVYDDVR